MARITRQVGPLVWKELRQLRRNKAALASSIVLPALTLVLAPLAQLTALRQADPGQLARAGGSAAHAAVLDRVGGPEALFGTLLMPLFVALTGVLVPAVATAYAVVAERERRSLDLLMALPVSVAGVLMAKVLSVLVTALIVILPLFGVSTGIMLWQRALTPVDVALLVLILGGALACSVGVTLVITIVARDYRTANNLSGLQVIPVAVLSPVLLTLLPRPVSMVALALALTGIGAFALLVAWRWITFERYLA